jgi:hypothetical protein
MVSIFALKPEDFYYVALRAPCLKRIQDDRAISLKTWMRAQRADIKIIDLTFCGIFTGFNQ